MMGCNFPNCNKKTQTRKKQNSQAVLDKPHFGNR